MFDPIALSHDHIVKSLIAVRDGTNTCDVANTFLSTLGSRQLELRSTLGSLGFASNFPSHALRSSPRHRVPSGATFCESCETYEFTPPKSQDLNILNFERHKWGGVRHTDPLYAWFDLEQFRKFAPQRPTEPDKDFMRRILEIAENLEDEATPIRLEKAITGVFPSNKYERRVLIEILGICGILQPRKHGGFFGEFTPGFEREQTKDSKNDWGYPVLLWRGIDGVNWAAVRAWFPDL